MVTSEFRVSGMITVMATDLTVSISKIGYLVSIYAFAMARGGPLLTLALLKTLPKTSLMILYLIFVISESIDAFARSWYMLAAARLLTGSVSGAFFGTAVAICVQLVSERQRGWATSIILGGIMVGTVLGLPMANVIGAHLGWRASFWATAGLSVVAAVVSMTTIPPMPAHAALSLWGELAALKNLKLWAAFSTSLLIIGATFAAFTYFIPILKTVFGYGDSAIATLLFVYGVATVIGNTVVEKLADRHTISVLAVGLCLLTLFLSLFGTFTDSKAVSALSLIGIGLVGVDGLPRDAHGERTPAGQYDAHTSVITLGIVIGAFLGGLCISGGYGLRAPLWVGAGMAVVGLVTLIPEIHAAGRIADVSERWLNFYHHEWSLV
ncbi:MAG: hypothetical protein CBARDMAM_5939 [uncultured Caballeronia sp.]|nr:MAG: hypothetical protein CBARDMAM_5939 [uncultured Caballeronia sp.]